MRRENEMSALQIRNQLRTCRPSGLSLTGAGVA